MTSAGEVLFSPGEVFKLINQPDFELASSCSVTNSSPVSP